MINCDSQAAIKAVDSTKIKSKTLDESVSLLNKLGETNTVTVRCIPAHNGYEGNERADLLAKNGANNIDALSASIPIPKSNWDTALKNRTNMIMQENWKSLPPSHFKRLWRDKFSDRLQRLNRDQLRKATQFLTGHAAVNYHLNKYNANISKTCPHCLAEEETINHFLGQCPKWSLHRSAMFDSFYLSDSDIVDCFDLPTILAFINATKRLIPYTKQ